MGLGTLSASSRGSRILVLIIFFLALLLPYGAEAFTGGPPSLIPRYLLRGDVTFDYEGDRGDIEKRDRFTQRYHLILDGYIKDPRLVFFELEGSFTNRTQEPGNRNEYMFGGNIWLLNQRVVRGPLRNFPQPIQLRFEYLKTDSSDYYTYGTSLVYNLPGTNLAFFQKGKIVSLVSGRPGVPEGPAGNGNAPNKEGNEGNAGGNEGNATNRGGNEGNTGGNNNNVIKERGRQQGGLVVPFPTFYLDYDSSKTTVSSSGVDLKDDRLDLRAESILQNSQYRAEYRHNKTDLNNTSYTDDIIDLRADYQFPDKSTARTFDVWNRFFYHKVDTTSFTNISSNGVWVQRFGKDLQDAFLVAGGARYSTSDISSGYGGDLSSTYRRRFSERLNNSATASLGYNSTSNANLNPLGPATDEKNHTASVSDDLTYQLSNRVLLRGGLFAGETESVPEYRIGLGASTNTRIAVAADYWYGHAGDGDMESDTHRVNLNLSTVLLRNFFFISRNYYQIQNFVHGGSQKNLNLQGDIYWNISRFRFQLGAAYNSLKNTGTIPVGTDTAHALGSPLNTLEDTNTILVRAVASTSFKRKLFLFARFDYSHDNNGLSYWELEPSLTWLYRQVYLSARYIARRTTQPGQNSTTDQRLFITLRRDFYRELRPFF